MHQHLEPQQLLLFLNLAMLPLEVQQLLLMHHLLLATPSIMRLLLMFMAPRIPSLAMDPNSRMELKYLVLMEPSLLLQRLHQHPAPLKAAWLLATAGLKMQKEVRRKQKEVAAEDSAKLVEVGRNENSDRVVVLVRDAKLQVIYL